MATITAALEPFVQKRQSPFQAALYVLRFVAPLRRALLAQRPSDRPEDADRNNVLRLVQDLVRTDAVRPSTRALYDLLCEMDLYCDGVNEPYAHLFALLDGFEGMMSLFTRSTLCSYGADHVRTGEDQVLSVRVSGKNLIQALDDYHDPDDDVRRHRWRDTPRVLYVMVDRITFNIEAMCKVELGDRFEYPLELDVRPYCVPKADDDEAITVPTTYSLALVHTYVRKTEEYLTHQTFVRDLESASTCRWLMVDHKNRMSFCSHHEALEESFGSKKGRRVMGLVYLRSDMVPERHSLKHRAARAARAWLPQQPLRLPVALPVELKAYLDQLE